MIGIITGVILIVLGWLIWFFKLADIISGYKDGKLMGKEVDETKLTRTVGVIIIIIGIITILWGLVQI